MSGMFGSSGGSSAQQQVYAGIQVSTSLYGGCIPYVAGRQRVPYNLLWFGNFQVHTSNSGGGKGGGGSGTKQYSYSAAYIAGLCIGPIQGITNVWHDKALVNLSFENLALSEGGASFIGSISGTTLTITKMLGGFVAIGSVVANNGVAAGTTITAPGSGTGGAGTYTVSISQTVASANLRSSQLTWTGFPSGTPAAQQIPYDTLATVNSSSYNLGSSAAMPNLNFEIEGVVASYSVANSIFDADPSAVWPDYLLDPVHGALANYPGTPLTIGSSAAPLQGATNSYQAYCMSVGLLTSPYEDTQRQATDFLTELLQTTNSTCRLSVNTLELLPYCDSAVSATVAGTAFSYTPNLTPVYIFGDDDYNPGKDEPPVKLTQTPQTDTYNMVSIEYNDRSNYYNQAPVTCSDNNDIALFGPRLASQLSWHQITQANVALLAGQLWLNRQLYEINSYTCKVRSDYLLLEPGDYIGLTDSNLGLVNQVCQITQIEIDANYELTITALELPGVTRSTAQYNWAAAQGYFANYAADPGAIQAPGIFLMPPIPAALSEGITIGIAVCGQTSNGVWLGCDAYCSVDGGTTYQFVGTIPEAARYGTLTASLSAVADPDTSSTLSIALDNTNLQISTSVTHADADSNQSLIVVGHGSAVSEVMSFGAASLVSGGNYNLSYLRRGLYGSIDQSQPSGAAFVRLDGAIFQIAMDPGYAGQTIYFKFVSFNLYKQYGPQTLSGATAYPYTIPSALPVGGNLLLIPRGTCAVADNSVYKQPNGSGAWDSDAYSPQGYLNGCFVSWRAASGTSTEALMVGFSTNPVPSTNYPSLNFAIYQIAGALDIYESGTFIGTFGSYVAGDSFEVRYDGVTIRYFHNGALVRAIRAPGLTLYPKVCVFVPGAVVGNIQFGPASAVNQPSGSWLNTYPWVIGTNGSQGNYLDNYDGTNEDSAILLLAGPYDQSEALWQTRGLGAAQNGGWLNTGDLYGIDSTKTYRSVVWAAWNGVGTLGQIFHGCDPVYTNNLNGTQNTNPYFSDVSVGSITANKWYLFVGVLHGSGYGTVDTSQSGVYDPLTGVRVVAGSEYKCIAGAPYQTQRVFQYFSNDSGSLIYFGRPRWEEVNGNEPSITTLLSPAGVLAYADNLDEVPDGSTYAKTLAAYIASGVPYTYRGAWSGATAYKVGDEVTQAGNYYICTTAHTNHAPPNASFWTLLGPVTIDSLSDGSTYARPLSGYLVNGVPYTNRGAYSGATAYKQGDEVTLAGVTYLCVANSTGNAPPNASFWQVVGSPTAFIATNHCTISDTTATRDGTAATWDSCVYSILGYATCHISAKVNNLSDAVMIGLSSNPTASSVYTNMNYGWYNSAGTWTIYESGTNFAGANTTAALSDVPAVTYDAATITYLLNNVVKRTVSVSSLTLYGFCPFNSANSGLNSLSFGPTTNLAVQDTAQLGSNAASQIAVATRASAATYNFVSAALSVDDITCSVTTTGSPIGIDITVEINIHLLLANPNSPMQIYVTRDGAQVGTAIFDVIQFMNSQPGVGGEWNVQVTLTVVDTPAAGAHTYASHVNFAQTTNGGAPAAQITTTNPVLKVREYKR